jgi:hypothetical protein
MLKRPVRSIAVVLLLSANAACHRGPASAPLTRDDRGEFGANDRFGARILVADQMRDRATYQLSTPAHVVLLAVTPGTGIEPIARGQSDDTTLTSAGIHQLDAWQPLVPAAVPFQRSAVNEERFRRCVQRTAAERSHKPTSRTPQSADETVDPEAERDAQRICEVAMRKVATDNVRHYLVLIASDAPLTNDEVTARLRNLTITAEDAHSTISAIAEALYMDRKAAWSGYYMRW